MTPTEHAMFTDVETRRRYFCLTYDLKHPSGLQGSDMIWRCRCGSPQTYEAVGSTVEEAIKNAMTKATEMEASQSDGYVPGTLADLADFRDRWSMKHNALPVYHYELSDL
jgi:hypothetical protein